jgi:hypothetical protein
MKENMGVTPLAEISKKYSQSFLRSHYWRTLSSKERLLTLFLIKKYMHLALKRMIDFFFVAFLLIRRCLVAQCDQQDAGQ